jgi:hypothetical protein
MEPQEPRKTFSIKKSWTFLAVTLFFFAIISFLCISYLQKKASEHISFSAISNIPNVSISMNPDFNYKKIFTKEQLEKNTSFKDIKKIVFTLTTEPQIDNIFYANKEGTAVYTSTSQKYGDGTLFILVYMNSDLMIKTSNNTYLSDTASLLFFYRLYQLSTPTKPLGIDAFNKQYIKSDPSLHIMMVKKK